MQLGAQRVDRLPLFGQYPAHLNHFFARMVAFRFTGFDHRVVGRDLFTEFIFQLQQRPVAFANLMAQGIFNLPLMGRFIDRIDMRLGLFIQHRGHRVEGRQTFPAGVNRVSLQRLIARGQQRLIDSDAERQETLINTIGLFLTTVVTKVDRHKGIGLFRDRIKRHRPVELQLSPQRRHFLSPVRQNQIVIAHGTAIIAGIALCLQRMPQPEGQGGLKPHAIAFDQRARHRQRMAQGHDRQRLNRRLTAQAIP